MPTDNPDDDAEGPEYIWRTAIGRSDFSFRTVLHSPDGPFFLSLDHLKALVEKKSKAAILSAIFYFVSLAISFFIILEVSDIKIDVRTPLGGLENVPISNNIFLFVLSVTTMYFVTSGLNVLLIQKQIAAIFEHTGLDRSAAASRAIYVGARWSARDIWTDILLFRPVGFRSGVSHGLLVMFAILFMCFISLGHFAIIILAAYSGLEQASAGDPFSYYLVAWPAVIVIHFGIIGFLFAFLVPMKFRWSDAQDIKSVPNSDEVEAND